MEEIHTHTVEVRNVHSGCFMNRATSVSINKMTSRFDLDPELMKLVEQVQRLVTQSTRHPITVRALKR